MLFFPIQNEFTNKLPYFFSGVGYLYEQEHVIRPNGRPETEWSYHYYQIIQCLSGKGKVIFKHKSIIIQEGQILFLVPEEAHEYFALTDSWKVNWIIFSGTDLHNYVKNILQINHCGVYSFTAPHILSDKIKLLYHTAMSSNPAKTIYASTIIYDILMDIYRFSFQNQNSSVAEKTNKLAPVFDYIDKHYNEPVSLAVLAELVNITRQHLCTSFKALTSHTVSEYINMYRIQKSKELLLNHNSMQIKEISLNCGFNDVSYFCSVFKKYECVTPSEYREMRFPTDRQE